MLTVPAAAAAAQRSPKRRPRDCPAVQEGRHQREAEQSAARHQRTSDESHARQAVTSRRREGKAADEFNCCVRILAKIEAANRPRFVFGAQRSARS